MSPSSPLSPWRARLRAWALGLTVLAATGGALAAVAPVANGTVANGTVANGTVVVEARVADCPTSSPWSPQPKMPHEPAKLSVSLPSGYTGAVEVYIDVLGVRLLGPVGWRCQANYGEDGSGISTLQPIAETGHGRYERINADWMGACVGCTLSQACPLFASAEKQWRQDYAGMKCSDRPLPSRQVVTVLSANIVAFTDPGGVTGTGIFSGGPYPDNAVMTFYPNVKGSPSSRMGDCVLPPSQHAFCTSVLDEFIAWEGGPQGPVQ